MSQSIILIAQRSVTLEALKSKFEPYFDTDYTSPDRFVVDSGKDYLFVMQSDTIRRDYEACELENIPISNPTFFSVGFRNVRFLNQALPLFVDDCRIWVDTDSGEILPGTEFVSRLKTEFDIETKRRYKSHFPQGRKSV
jgi:hypothetical protein